MTPKAETAERKPRRKLTVADHLAMYDDRIGQLESDLERVKRDRAEYIAEQHARAAALTAELPTE